MILAELYLGVMILSQVCTVDIVGIQILLPISLKSLESLKIASEVVVDRSTVNLEEHFANYVEGIQILKAFDIDT